MTVIELRAKIKNGVDELSESNLAEIFLHLEELQKKEISEKNFERILKEDAEVLQKLAR